MLRDVQWRNHVNDWILDLGLKIINSRIGTEMLYNTEVGAKGRVKGEKQKRDL